MDSELQDHHSDPCLCTNVSNHRRRRLVVAFDGTENEFGPESSHVVEFYSRIVKSGDQLAYYTSGIGTFVPPSSRARRPRVWIKNKWASMMARDFKSNLLSGYRFLSDKYELGDQIFLLGFSRGAYQVRVLAAMIAKVGLLRTGNNEQIPFAFKMYTDPEASKDIPIVSKHPGLRGGTTTTAKEFKKAFCYDVNIHFVGVWDTVSSVGACRNKYYPGAERADNICFFRHALALDERRVKFLPEYVVAKKEWFSSGEFGRPRCKEVWFRGYHSDVGGGNLENTTSDNGAIPSRWMAYEAMLAGLEMTPFWGGIKARDLEPNIGKDPMTCIYKLLECLFVKWEVHSERYPPLLTSDEKPPPRYFSRAGHYKYPRQIFDHQKLHSSVCLHRDLSGTPFARLPNSWISQSGKKYGWAEVIKLLREKDERVRAPNSKSAMPTVASTERKSFRETVRNASSKSESESSSIDLRRQSVLAHQYLNQSLEDSASSRGGGMGGQSEVQNTSPGEVLIEPAAFRAPSPAPSLAPSLSLSSAPSPAPSLHSPVSSPTPSPVPSPASSLHWPVPSPVPLLHSPVHWPVPSLQSPVPSPVSSPFSSPHSSVSSPAEFTLPAEAIEWDLLDCNAIPALIGGVLRGTNVNEFLERLEVLAYSDIGKATIQQSNGNQFFSMIRQVCGDKKFAEHTGQAIQTAYEVLWHSDVDLYDSDIELWKIIHSKIVNWNELRMDTPASSLHRAVRLLHKTDSKRALVQIRNTIIGMFDQWQQSFDEHSAPVQLRFFLAIAVEFNVRDYVLHIAVFSSPHFSDAVFTKTLLNFLVDIIKTAGREEKKLAMLCFCILCAIDKEATLDKELFSALKSKFVEVGALMKEMWELVMPESSAKSSVVSITSARRSTLSFTESVRERASSGPSSALHGLGGNPEKMAELKELQNQISEDLRPIDRLWAHDALDKAIIFQQNRQFHVVPNAPLPYRRRYGGMPSVGEPFEGGMMSESNVFGGPPVGLWSLPSPSSIRASPPFSPSTEVGQRPLSTRSSVAQSLDPAPTTGNEELPLPEHASSDDGHDKVSPSWHLYRDPFSYP